MPNDQAIEGDYIRTKKNNLFFDVKGLLHPKDRIISFVRFYPDTTGERFRKGIHYKKIYDLSERYSFLKKNYPHYLFYSTQLNMELQGVRREEIERIYTPRGYLQNLIAKTKLSKIEQNAFDLCKLFIEKGDIPEQSIGITGSQMVGLNKEDSDIDLIIYGTEVARDFQDKIPEIFKHDNNLRKYNFEEYKQHFRFRAAGAQISFNDFMKSEPRKNHQGKFGGIDFFIRYIKSPQDWKGTYYDYQILDLGTISMLAEVIDASDSLFTPCTYYINPVRILASKAPVKNIEIDDIRKITSYRGRFCEHAYAGEVFMVEGKLERVIFKNREIYYQIVLGTQKTDKMLLI
ncbi:MAG: hypothetical protein BAJALOKI1v1_1250007 [Promethearchaeota archaeon]|nr:MAG: hypothetical protein BAJALOKI1v1_1250007 [Candidatus Lokiarchaeota archaeon]